MTSFLVGCSYYGDAHVYGLSFLASREDLRAVTVAVHREDPTNPIFAYRVISRDEIWVIPDEDLDASYTQYRRVNGRWEAGERTLVIKHQL